MLETSWANSCSESVDSWRSLPYYRQCIEVDFLRRCWSKRAARRRRLDLEKSVATFRSEQYFVGKAAWSPPTGCRVILILVRTWCLAGRDFGPGSVGPECPAILVGAQVLD